MKKYKISKYTKVIESSSRRTGLVYHSLYGRAVLVSSAVINSIKNAEQGIIDADKLPEKIADWFIWSGHLIQDNEKEDARASKGSELNNSIDNLRLCISENCNLNCTYCYVSQCLKPAYMPFEIAKKAIDEYCKIIKRRSRKGSITFFGGEPLLNWDVLKNSIEWIRYKYSDLKININIVTNGTILNRVRAEFFKKHHVSISISLDGPKESHDLVRRTKNNRGSYDIITQNIDLLRKVGHPPNTIVCTLGEHNIDALDQFLKYASDNMLCATINDAFAEPRNKVYCCGEQKILESLLNAERVSKRLKVPMDGTWKWPYNKLFSDRPGCLRHCAACGGEMCVDCNGNIKPCPGFAEYFGNVSDIEAALRSDNYLRFKSRAVPNLPDCVGCEIEGLCSGGCMLNASKNHSGNIFKKSESCFLNKNAFKSLAYDFIERNEVRTKP